MAYEYKIVSGVGGGGQGIFGTAVRRWKGLEKEINQLVSDGWEVVSSSTASCGNFILLNVLTTFVLRKSKS